LSDKFSLISPGPHYFKAFFPFQLNSTSPIYASILNRHELIHTFQPWAPVKFGLVNKTLFFGPMEDYSLSIPKPVTLVSPWYSAYPWIRKGPISDSALAIPVSMLGRKPVSV